MTTTPTDPAPSSPTPPAEPAGPTDPVIPAEPAGPTDTAAELADAMTRAIKRIRRLTSERLEPYGITPGQARALRTLAHAPGCEVPDRAMRLSDLADRLHIAPRSATTVVDALEEAGLVERSPDPADRRAVRILLTEAGRAAVERIGLVRHEVAQEYFGEVGPADQDAVLRVLRAAETRYAGRWPSPGRP
ncbi:MarR family transcriptional regulator [Streptomyces sp. SP17BM10]|uniref:MarR family winged helix-turn-helix transcriptional regulator n=1 Tax=Streptomyces sp. SP17BM10 TaxID=3002530 RepID=UPI002E7A5C9C|nr:MarR family transcriptional regulator [Streptomyces sp. SP17BM10]MEE1785575.1 MarR family transcriptional regulator [Streptomyces sp. SP17BM10]